MSLIALAWKWGDGCASARLEGDKIVITKWNRSDRGKPTDQEIEAAVEEWRNASSPLPPKPLTAEEVWAVLEAKGLVDARDRPKR